MSEWRKYWTPEEYADICSRLSPEAVEEELFLEAELARMRAKTEHYRIAEDLGFSPEEALLMRLGARVAAEERNGA